MSCPLDPARSHWLSIVKLSHLNLGGTDHLGRVSRTICAISRTGSQPPDKTREEVRDQANGGNRKSDSRGPEFANALFNALEAAGHRVALAHRGAQLFRPMIEENEVPKKRIGELYPPLWSPCEPTVVYVDEVPVGLSIVELSEAVLMRWVNGGFIRDSEYAPPKSKRFQVDHTWTAMRDVRSGRLRLIAYAPRQAVGFSRQWEEAKGGSLVDQIPSIVGAMPNLAVQVAAKVEAAELEWQERHRQWEIEARRRDRAEDRKKAQASRKERQQHLERIISNWANVISIDHFYSGVEARVEDLPAADANVLRQRLNLAREFVGTLDPLQFYLEWKTPEERYRPPGTRSAGP